jgi:hypothetical protein
MKLPLDKPWRWGLCPETGKRIFHSKLEAELTLMELQLKHPSGFRHGVRLERNTYLCPHCNYWHLTKQRGFKFYAGKP